MIAILGKYLWIPRVEADEAKIKSELTVYAYKYVGDREKITLYRYSADDKYIGVPRNWGLENKWVWDGEINDCTSIRTIEWPVIKIEYRKGQREAIDAIEKSLRGGKYGALLEAPPGSGKTFMGLAIAARLQVQVLIVVHKGDLSRQWHESASKFFPGAKGGHVQADTWDWKEKHYVTAMAQTLYTRSNVLDNGFVSNFGLVIYDEGHRYPARTFEHVLSRFPSRYRLGVSATWRRGDKLECIWHWHVGHIEHVMRTTQLTGEYAQIPWKTALSDGMMKLKGRVHIAKWLQAMTDSDLYNKWLSDMIVRGAGVGRKVLVVSDRIKHLENLRNRIIQKGTGQTVGMYIGGKSREELISATKCTIILASYRMIGEGSDIPALDTLFLATPRRDIEQVVGRIQRPVDKKKLIVVDIIFDTPYNRALGKARKKTYERIGFTEQSAD